ncbi:hypothetical protein [Acanthopleuribacter pedis]|uniref:Uncharacterized protein n=1 Tax=Acanthopleuribacter pedis TaxID=442870 RepID=A0A8J7QKP5_9BACT|nr:hypothetical protein [Acanthopleuribacter pedis]MBO1322811.1 hypothetical protein [Acanthopleuribacter pedis]
MRTLLIVFLTTAPSSEPTPAATPNPAHSFLEARRKAMRKQFMGKA